MCSRLSVMGNIHLGSVCQRPGHVQVPQYKGDCSSFPSLDQCILPSYNLENCSYFTVCWLPTQQAASPVQRDLSRQSSWSHRAAQTPRIQKAKLLVSAGLMKMPCCCLGSPGGHSTASRSCSSVGQQRDESGCLCFVDLCQEAE